MSDLDSIIVRGARVHNLKNIDFEIPHNALTRGHGRFPGSREVESGVFGYHLRRGAAALCGIRCRHTRGSSSKRMEKPDDR